MRFLTEEEVRPNVVDLDAKPRKKKPGRPEHEYQVTQVDYMRTQFPSWIAIAVPNEAQSTAMSEGAARKWRKDREDAGVLTGAPDVFYFGPFPTCVICENKSLKGPVRDSQKAIHAKLAALGWEVHVSRTLDDLQAYLRRRGLIR